MRRLFSALLVALLVACATPLQTGTFNDRAAQAMVSVTAARQSATALLVAGKITLEQDQAMQARLDAVRATIELARTTFPTNADQATLLLVDALNRLAAAKAKP